ncbi:MAG: hypothetical protein QXI16_06535, partial [Sulfolobaceae archaeon]
GIIDKALSTANSGYLTRKLIYSLQHILLAEDDCHTTKGLPIKILPTNYSKYLYRYTVDGTYLTKQNISNYFDKVVELRSPIFCKSKSGVCKKCYSLGDFYNSKTIGFISAQALGEPGTQLVLRSFHTGGSAELKIFNYPNIFKITDDNVYVNIVPVRLRSENLVVDLANKLEADADLIIDYEDTEDRQEIIVLPRGTQLLLSPEKFLDFHNVNTRLFSVEVSAVDLATDLTYISTIVGKKYKMSYKDSFSVLEKLENIYWGYQNIHSLHFELLHAERLRKIDGTYARFSDNIDPDTEIILESISNIAHSRLLLSLCFENFRKFFNTYLDSTQIKLSPLELLIKDISKLS